MIEVPDKDESEHPVPSRWRPVFLLIANAFAERDYLLKAEVPGVAAVSADTAQQIESYIADYGATLVPLPEDTWRSSVCSWTGDGWDVLVDLWTVEEGRSDMVLSARVYESTNGFEYHVLMVYVP